MRRQRVRSTAIKEEALVHFVLIVQVCSLTIENQVFQFLPNINISEQFESILVTILQHISFLLL